MSTNTQNALKPCPECGSGECAIVSDGRAFAVAIGGYYRLRYDIWRGDEDPHVAVAKGTLVYVLDADERDVQVSTSNGATYILHPSDLAPDLEREVARLQDALAAMQRRAEAAEADWQAALRRAVDAERERDELVSVGWDALHTLENEQSAGTQFDEPGWVRGTIDLLKTLFATEPSR